MNRRPAWPLLILLTVLLCGTPFGGLSAQTFSQGQCTVSVLNQTANVLPDGTWNLPNIPSNMGPVRARVTCVDGDETLSGASDFFTITPNRMNAIPKVELGTGAATPEDITFTLPLTTFTSPGQTAQATVTALFPNGSMEDVTSAVAGTVYSTSNPAVATVSPNGQVTALGSGRALISALHEAILESALITAILSPDSDGDGLPDDFELSLGLDPQDPVDAFEDLDLDGLTNREEFDLGTRLDARDTDGDTVADGEEVAAGDDGFVTNPLLADTDSDGVRDGLETRVGTDPTDRASVDYAAVLVRLQAQPASFTLVNNTLLPDEVSRRLRVEGVLVDGSVADLTARGTSYSSSDLTVANFGSEPGRVFAGADGTATVTASLGGFETTVEVIVTTFTPRALSVLRIPGFANGVATEGGFAYVAAGTTGLQVVDATDPAAPFIVGSLDTPGNANDVRVAGGLAFVADGDRGLQVIDVGVPTSPLLVGSVDTPGIATDLVVAGSRVYVADGAAGVAVIDVSVPSSPVHLGQVDTPGNARGVDFGGGFVVVADATGGVHVVDVSNPFAPTIVGSVHTRGSSSHAADVAVRDRLAYVADGSDRTLGGLKAIDFSDPITPVVVGATANGFGLAGVALDRNLALAADYFFVNAVPAFDVRQVAPAIRGTIDFSRAPSFRDDNGNGVAVQSGLVYLVGARFTITDNGSSGDSVLHIGRYAVLDDGLGVSPVVQLTAPADGATVLERRPLLLAAAASDDVLVESVEFLVDGQPVGRDFSPPYELVLTAPSDEGPVAIQAVATDLGGNQGFSEEVTVTVLPDSAPTVAIIAPTAGSRVTEGATVQVSASASDDSAVSSVEFFADGGSVGTDFSAPYRFNVLVPSGGSQLTLTAVATDDVGQTATSDTVVLGIDANQPPSVDIVEPLDGEEVIEGSTLRVVAGATDDVGVASVRFFVDGAPVSVDTTAPYELDVEVPLDATLLVLGAEATDSSGQTTVAADVNLTVIPDPGTTVVGTVVLEDGSLAAGAQVTLFDLLTTTDGDGGFELIDVPTVRGDIVVSARLGELSGSSAPAFPVPDGITDVGTIRLTSARFEPDFGTNLFQGDDDFDAIDLGFSFPFYGTGQTRLFVGSNGFITFGSGDTDFTESISEHLIPQPRISVFFDDLFPGIAGNDRQVYVNQLADPNRLVVTWDRVPEFFNAGSNTLQAVLFESGRIQFGYAGMTAPDAVVGLSPGGSVLPPFELVDYSSLTGPVSFDGGTGIVEQFTFTSPFDLDNGFVLFEPNGLGGYDVRFLRAAATSFLALFGTVEGRVLEADGTPVVDVELTVTMSHEPGYVGMARTDREGRYRVEGVPFGGAVRVHAYGREDLRGARLTAVGDGTVRIDLAPVEVPDKPVDE